MDEKFFTTEQVANILQVHPFTILKFIKQGKLKGIKLGRVYRIKESDINGFIEERMTKQSHKETKMPDKIEMGKSREINTQEVVYPVKKDNKRDEGNHYYII